MVLTDCLANTIRIDGRLDRYLVEAEPAGPVDDPSCALLDRQFLTRDAVHTGVVSGACPLDMLGGPIPATQKALQRSGQHWPSGWLGRPLLLPKTQAPTLPTRAELLWLRPTEPLCMTRSS